mgnify:CR=1 FL=1
MSSSLRSKPLLELLRIGIDRGVIDTWRVAGPQIVFTKDGMEFSVRAVEAGSLLQKILLDQQEAGTGENGVSEGQWQ